MSERHQKVESQRADEWRGTYAARWRERYGESIDCGELVAIASPAEIAKARLEVQASRLLTQYAAMIECHKEAEVALLERRLPGESATLFETIQAIGGYAEGAPPVSFGRVSLPLLVQRRSLEVEAIARWLRRQAATWPPAGARGRVADLALDRACYALGEWIRPRHRGPNGERDSNIAWPDVASALEWHGNDLTAIAGNKKDAVRRRADRWQQAVEKAARFHDIGERASATTRMSFRSNR